MWQTSKSNTKGFTLRQIGSPSWDVSTNGKQTNEDISGLKPDISPLLYVNVDLGVLDSSNALQDILHKLVFARSLPNKIFSTTLTLNPTQVQLVLDQL